MENRLGDLGVGRYGTRPLNALGKKERETLEDFKTFDNYIKNIPKKKCNTLRTSEQNILHI
jgi:hypothetical protein